VNGDSRVENPDGYVEHGLVRARTDLSTVADAFADYTV
jgi:hypothetical protein